MQYRETHVRFQCLSIFPTAPHRLLQIANCLFALTRRGVGLCEQHMWPGAVRNLCHQLETGVRRLPVSRFECLLPIVDALDPDVIERSTVDQAFALSPGVRCLIP